MTAPRTDETVLSAIGHTPLVQLPRLFANSRGIRVYAKLELLNPGGSAKDRPALRMICEAWRLGRIGPGSVIVESSSGNTAISLAILCAQYELRFICVVDPRTAATNLAILRALGAEIDTVTEPDPATGEFLPARLYRVRQLLSTVTNSYWPNQYENDDNWRSQREMMREIVETAGPVDCVVGGVSTCGTMRGCADYVREQSLPTRIVAVDVETSAIIGGRPGRRLFPGMGAGIVPPFAKLPFWDEAIAVSDEEMVAGCRALARQEGLLAGPSSGGVASAALRLMWRLPDRATCAILLHDRGERYLDTVYSDEWVLSKFGRIPTIDREEDSAC